MTEQLSAFIASHQPSIEQALHEALPLSAQPGAKRLNEALRYAIFPGGKRLRPVLTLLGSQLAGATREQAVTNACAVEFLHSSSLILDDLPGMDDADLRRNRRALHLVYGEGIAVLAALALLNQSYALLVQSARYAERKSAVEVLLREAARCIGSDGMIGGQVVDLEMRAGCLEREALASRDLKTIALMRLMMTAGALAVGADELLTLALAKFGECFGRAYQICDDLLDQLGDPQATGKNIRQDTRHLRPTFVAELGVDGAYALAQSLLAEGVSLLEERFGPRSEVRLLGDAADLVISRVGYAEMNTRAEAATHAASLRL